MQIALTLPASERLGRPDRRALEDFQAVAQASSEPAIQKQMRTLPAGYMGNVHRNILDLGIEQLALAGENAHAAVFDKDIAADLADRRPARLERQFGIMHLEKQADTARRVLGSVIERALILEKALVHRPLTMAVRNHSSSAGLRTAGKYLAV